MSANIHMLVEKPRKVDLFDRQLRMTADSVLEIKEVYIMAVFHQLPQRVHKELLDMINAQ